MIRQRRRQTHQPLSAAQKASEIRLAIIAVSSGLIAIVLLLIALGVDA